MVNSHHTIYWFAIYKLYTSYHIKVAPKRVLTPFDTFNVNVARVLNDKRAMEVWDTSDDRIRWPAHEAQDPGMSPPISG